MSRTIKNVEESVKFFTWQMMAKNLEGDTWNKVKHCLDLRENISDDPEYEEKLAQANKEVMEAFSEEELKEVNDLGSDHPCDTIDVYLDLGSLLFELWSKATPVPSAPLARELYRRNRAKLAESLKSDALTVSDEVRAAAEKVLGNDKAWESAVITVRINGREGGEPARRYVTVGTKVVDAYGKILNGLVNATIPDEYLNEGK